MRVRQTTQRRAESVARGTYIGKRGARDDDGKRRNAKQGRSANKDDRLKIDSEKISLQMKKKKDKKRAATTWQTTAWQRRHGQRKQPKIGMAKKDGNAKEE